MDGKMTKRVRLSVHQKRAVMYITSNFGNQWFNKIKCKYTFETLNALVNKGFLEKRDIVKVSSNQLSYHVMGAEYRYIKD